MWGWGGVERERVDMISLCLSYKQLEQLEQGCYAVARDKFDPTTFRLYGKNPTTIPPHPLKVVRANKMQYNINTTYKYSKSTTILLVIP